MDYKLNKFDIKSCVYIMFDGILLNFVENVFPKSPNSKNKSKKWYP
jgi:hypothetical protein